MASVNSVAVGEGRKSVGEFTYRYVNGKTIASKRVYKNKSNTQAQQRQRHSFAEIQSIRKEIRAIIEVGFCKSGKLTPANYFYKVNTYYSTYLRENVILERHDTPILNLYKALSDPHFTTRKVFAAYGGKTIECDSEWDTGNLPVITINSPYEFIPGDIITIAFAISYESSRIRYEKTRLFPKTLTADDIDQLSVATTFVASNQTIPGLDPLANIHADATDVKVIAAAILHTANVTADTGNATSLFMNMPVQPIIYHADTQELNEDGESTMRISSNKPESFPAGLAQNAIGAILVFNSPDIPLSYNVTAIRLDAKQQPIGLVLTDPHEYDYDADLFGEQAGPVPLILDGTPIAYIKNLRIPKVVI